MRLRHGMYLQPLPVPTQLNYGIHTLIKYAVDYSIEEFRNGFGRNVEITVEDKVVTIRDYGCRWPLNNPLSTVNTDMNCDNNNDRKWLYLKIVNCLSSEFSVKSVCDDNAHIVGFSKGLLVDDFCKESLTEKSGTEFRFKADEEIFGEYSYNMEFVERLIRNYTYHNVGLTIVLNGTEYTSKNGLLDLVRENAPWESLYEPIHLKSKDIEIVLFHHANHGEAATYYSFVNGYYTSQGGTHLEAFKKAFIKVIKDCYKKKYNPIDICASMVAAISLQMSDPTFSSSTKVGLGSREMYKDGPLIRNYIDNFLSFELGDYLHKHTDVAQAIQNEIVANEKARKAICRIRKRNNPF